MPKEVVRISNFAVTLQKTEIADLLKFYALKLNKRIHFFNNVEGSLKEKENFSAEVLFIDVNNLSSSNSNGHHTYKIVKVGDKEFGFSGVHILNGLQPKEDEKVILDELDQEIARVYYNIVYIPFELIPNSTKDLSTSFAILRYILEKASALLNFDNSKWLEIQRKESLKSYINLLKEGFSREKKLAKQRIETSQKDIAEFCQRLQRAYRQVQEDQELCMMFETQKTEYLEAKATTDFEKMRKMIERGVYEDIQFSNGICTATTGECYVSHEGKRFFVGRFRVNIAQDIKFENLDYARKEYPHPHISNSGFPCYGNIGAELTKLIGSKEYLLALELIFRYLNSYNHRDAYVKFDQSSWIWKEVDAEGKVKAKKKEKSDE